MTATGAPVYDVLKALGFTEDELRRLIIGLGNLRLPPGPERIAAARALLAAMLAPARTELDQVRLIEPEQPPAAELHRNSTVSESNAGNSTVATAVFPESESAPMVPNLPQWRIDHILRQRQAMKRR
jgi:hypothetical protein